MPPLSGDHASANADLWHEKIVNTGAPVRRWQYSVPLCGSHSGGNRPQQPAERRHGFLRVFSGRFLQAPLRISDSVREAYSNKGLALVGSGGECDIGEEKK